MQLTPPSLRGLYALCVLGVKGGGADLVSAAMAEMERALPDPEGDADVAWLRAVVAGPCAGRQAEARRRLAGLLHSRPDRAGLWRAAAKFLLATQEVEEGGKYLRGAAW